MLALAERIYKTIKLNKKSYTSLDILRNETGPIAFAQLVPNNNLIFAYSKVTIILCIVV